MLHNLQIVSKLVVSKLLRTIALLMRNFIANFVRILGICKDFAGNRVNELGDVQETCSFICCVCCASKIRATKTQQI